VCATPGLLPRFSPLFEGPTETLRFKVRPQVRYLGCINAEGEKHEADQVPEQVMIVGGIAHSGVERRDGRWQLPQVLVIALAESLYFEMVRELVARVADQITGS
jgi:hypothetical protein